MATNGLDLDPLLLIDTFLRPILACTLFFPFLLASSVRVVVWPFSIFIAVVLGDQLTALEVNIHLDRSITIGHTVVRARVDNIVDGEDQFDVIPFPCQHVPSVDAKRWRILAGIAGRLQPGRRAIRAHHHAPVMAVTTDQRAESVLARLVRLARIAETELGDGQSARVEQQARVLEPLRLEIGITIASGILVRLMAIGEAAARQRVRLRIAPIILWLPVTIHPPAVMSFGVPEAEG